MFSLDVKVNRKRIDTLVKELNYVNSSTFLRSLDLRTKSAIVLAVLKGATPVSQDLTRGNKPEFGIQLSESWEARIETDGSSSLSFVIDSMLRKLPRGDTVIASLDQGTQGYTVVPEDDIRFYGYHYSRKISGRNEGWVTLEAGVPVQYSPRPGFHFIDKTYEFIQAVMIPQLKADIEEKVRRRMERI